MEIKISDMDTRLIERDDNAWNICDDLEPMLSCYCLRLI